jgi:hypothetical protein
MIVTMQHRRQSTQMRISKIASAIALIAWGLFAFLGWRLILGEAAIGISDYPIVAQRRYFAYLPTFLFGIAIGLFALSLSARTPVRLKGLAGVFSGLLIAALPIYIVWWVGGVRPH